MNIVIVSLEFKYILCSAFDFSLTIKEISINSKNEGEKRTMTTLHQMHDDERNWLRL
jgi:hypothetical protein